MKKNIFIFILICIAIFSTSCTVAPNAPSNGIWHCKELKLAIEWRKHQNIVYSYDINLASRDLQIRDWNDGGFDIICDDDNGDIIEIYSGWKKYTSEHEFVIALYSKANPKDNFETQIELDDEEYIFVKIQSYDEISEVNAN